MSLEWFGGCFGPKICHNCNILIKLEEGASEGPMGRKGKKGWGMGFLR